MTAQNHIRRKFVMVPNAALSAATTATRLYCPVSLPAAPWEPESKPPPARPSRDSKGRIDGRFYEEGEFPCPRNA